METSTVVLLAASLCASLPAIAQQAPAAALPAQAGPAATVPPLAPRPAPAPPRMTAAEEAKLRRQDAGMVRGAQQAMALVDADRIGEVWDGASPAMKRLVTKDEFVRQVSDDRRRAGTVLERGEAAVSRARFPAGQRVPQGLYTNVATPTTFANAPQPVRELVSFRLDEDRVWRVSGYSLR